MNSGFWSFLAISLFFVLLGVVLSVITFFSDRQEISPLTCLQLSLVGLVFLGCSYALFKQTTKTCTVTGVDRAQGRVTTRECGPLVLRDDGTSDKLTVGRTYRLTLSGGPLWLDPNIDEVHQ